MGVCVVGVGGLDGRAERLIKKDLTYVVDVATNDGVIRKNGVVVMRYHVLVDCSAGIVTWEDLQNGQVSKYFLFEISVKYE